MNEERESLIARALNTLSRGHNDPARAALEDIISEHGREQVAKAASDLGLEPELSDEELAAVEALAAEGESESGASGSDNPVEARLAKLEEKIDKLASGNTEGEGEGEGEALPEDELALVKSGVPVDQIEEARPMLRSQDEDARKAAFAMLAKQASPQRKALLAKEIGSSDIPAEDADKERMKAQLAKADGEDPDRKPTVEAALEILRRAG